MTLPAVVPEVMELEPEAGLQLPFPEPNWASYVEQGDWRTLGIVDPERAAEVDAEIVLKQIDEKRLMSDRARAPLERDWDLWEDQYHLRTEDLEKEPWQADITMPEVYNTIRSLVSLARSGLFDAGKWFRFIERNRDMSNGWLRPVEKWVRYAAERGEFREQSLLALEQAWLLGSGCMTVSMESMIRHRPDIQEVPIYGDPQMAFQAAMQGMPTTRPIVTAIPEAVSQVECKYRNIRHVYPDPWAANPRAMKWILDESEVDLEDLEERVRAGVYDSIDDIGEPVRRTYSFEEELSISQARQGKRERHLVTEYTGNIYDGDGRIVAKNWVITTVNRRAIVRMGPNPLWSGRTRYLWCTPIPFPDRIWGKSAIETESDVQEEMSQLLNLMLDDTKYSVLGAFMVNEDESDEPVETTRIEPGRVYRGRNQFIQKIMFQSNAAGAFPMLNQLSNIGDKASRVSEWVDGTPSSRGRPTATEVQTKSSAGTQFLDTMLKSVEQNFIVPGVELVLEYLMQFGDDVNDPNLEEIMREWGGTTQLLDPVSRLQLLSQNFKIQAQGMSMILDRNDLMTRTMQMHQVLMQSGLAQSKPQAILELIYTQFESLGLDPARYGFAESPEEELMVLFGMQAAPGAGQPGMGAAPEPAPGGAPALPTPDAQMRQNQAQGPPVAA